MNHLITLQEIRNYGPCPDGWTKLLTALGENNAKPDLTRRVSIGDVAHANGAADALWCLRCIDDPRMRVRAVMPTVKRASQHTDDERVHKGCIAVIEQWLAGNDSADLKTAQAAARTAARAAESAVANAAAAWAAARAAESAAEAAAWAAAWAADLAAADAAYAAARTAWAATEAAAAAAEAAAAASYAAVEAAAWAAARADAADAAAAERERQRADLLEIFPLHAFKHQADEEQIADHEKVTS